MELVTHPSAQSDCGDGQIGRMHAGCALEHTVMSGFLRIRTHQVPAEKPEMLSVSEVKDIPYDECDPAEEFFSVCIALVQRRKHGPVKKHTVHQCFLRGSCPSHNCVQKFLWVVSISPWCYFLLLSCLLSHLSLWRVASLQLVFGSALLFIFPDSLVYFPYVLQTKIGNCGKLIKLYLGAFVFQRVSQCFQQSSWTW